MQSTSFEQLKGSQKRGIWQYDINNAFSFTEEEVAKMEEEEAVAASQAEAEENTEPQDEEAADVSELKE